ncbi:MAG: hypothetical protein EP326_00720 [Deltaproteobacteria bacterium]|nr:MAG: hypothetical protein EP326_00720 [Deltaproteobacteria bacterium]
MKTLILSSVLVFSFQANAYETLLTETKFDTLRIAGEEYWEFDDDRPGSPYSQNRIIWSYNSAPPNAKKCAQIAYKKLTGWLKDHNSPVFKVMKGYQKAGGVGGIYLWVNDYTKAPKQSLNPRKSQVWIYENSLYKFESTLMPDGTCHTPTEKQIVNYLNAKIVAKGMERIDTEQQLSSDHSDSIGEVAVNNSSRGGFWAGIKRFFSFGGGSEGSSSSGGSGSAQ